ncbi:DUF1839 family protein [Nocardioides anomalus]|uniref:DUF1839 family protein n=1 Tax=Nocardioides anomalus TaxID=2712223 RepID=A0A6G6WAF4_9ACTN|nr:DUF1839 family protein [Nocardioides anomalus]QIG42189.1 DUF1839 family protein [Nocardioides anomalus]
MISLFDLDPSSYAEHPIHSDERTYSETNCYVDCLVEFVQSAGLEPEAMMGGAVASDFELDQWSFFKPTPGDLFRLYGIDLHEVQPYRGFPTLIATRLAAGQTVMPEVDSFYLPDVAATSYRTDHVKSTIIAESIDEDARVLRYFHNTGYHELAGEDYDQLFATYSGDGHLPTYVELIRPQAGPVPTGDALRAVARELLAGYLARRPGDNPFLRFSAQLEADLPALIAGSSADYNAYAFHNPRMVGASMELLAGHVRWLFEEDGEKAATHLDDVVGGSKMLLFRLARQRQFDAAGVVGPMAEAYDAALTELDALVS